jgi:HD-like signal output (HDOD) protein
MAEKSILIADADPNARIVFRDALGGDWEVVGVGTGGAGLEEAKKHPFHAVVANHTLPDFTGGELLNLFRVYHPKTLRFIAVAEALKEKVMCDVSGDHQFLSIPFNRATLKNSIERSLATDYGMSHSLRELVGSIRTFPTIPSLYVEVANALKDPNASTEKIGAIIAKDMAMTTKLVQVLNSAYFGLPRIITDPNEAVGILGFETVKSLVMTVKLLSQYDKMKPVYFSIDNIWKHSTNVARRARDIALLETGDNASSGVAYTAGLMHDLGKVILAANFDGQYHGAHNIARKQQIPLWEVEKDIFGATHGEIGAYLLGLWGMSEEVVKSAALHHYPLGAGDKTFSALTAVHAANVLEYEGISETDGLVAPVLDAEYLRQLGLEERAVLWRDVDAVALESKGHRARPAVKPVAKAIDPAPAAPMDKAAPTKSSPAPSRFQGVWKWLAFGLGAAATLVLLARLEITRSEGNLDKPEGQKVAKIPPQPVNHEVPAIVAPVSPVERPNLALVQPTNAAAIAAVRQQPVANPAPAPVQTALDKLVLQGIFYSSDHPSAMISGQLAHLGEEVTKCRVLGITPSSVTMQYLDQRRTLTLK